MLCYDLVICASVICIQFWISRICCFGFSILWLKVNKTCEAIIVSSPFIFLYCGSRKGGMRNTEHFWVAFLTQLWAKKFINFFSREKDTHYLRVCLWGVHRLWKGGIRQIFLPLPRNYHHKEHLQEMGFPLIKKLYYYQNYENVLHKVAQYNNYLEIDRRLVSLLVKGV